MRKTFFHLSLMLVLCSCSNIQQVATVDYTAPVENQESRLIASFPYPLIKWEDAVYRVTSEQVTHVDKNVGEILFYSLEEADEVSSQNGFSNIFTVGTEIWSIDGANPLEKLAVEQEKGTYIVVINDSFKTD